MSIIRKINKALKLCATPSYIPALFKGVGASIEHAGVMKGYKFGCVVDIGANRGQFALLSRELFPDAKIYSFEPLATPAHIFNKLFTSDGRVKLYNYAIGDRNADVTIHVSNQDDSSSLLPISSLQNKTYPGTYEVSQETIKEATLDTLLSEDDICSPSLLKIDVQGYERSTLAGCRKLLHKFDVIYIELSFVELYSGQALANEIVQLLQQQSFQLCGVNNISIDNDGKSIQADFLFEKIKLS